MDVRPAAVLGFLALVVLTVAAWRAPVVAGVEPVGGPLGWLTPQSSSATFTAVVVLPALALLVGCWWNLVAQARAGAPLRPLVRTGALWSLPLLIAPPLLSMDAFAYLAQGRMLVRGLDAYADGPVLLGDDPALGAMDPLWRTSPTPYGPVALVVLKAVSLGSGGAAGGGLGVVLLRMLAIAGVVAAVAAALALTPQPRRAQVLALTALNPVTVVHLVGGAHVDALLAGAVGVAVLATVRGRSRVGVLLAAIAVAVKVVVLPVLLLLVVRAPRRQAPGLLLLATAPFVLSALVVGRPWGFLGALTVPGVVVSWYAPATLVGRLLDGSAAVLGLPLEAAQALAVGRAVVLLAGAALVGLLLLRTARSGAGPDALLRRAGMILLVVALSLPAVHPWYLGTALFLLAAAGAVRTVVTLSSLLALSVTPPLREVDPLVLGAIWVLVMSLLLAAGRAAQERPAQAEPAPAPTTPGWRAPVLGAAVLAPFVFVGVLAGSATAQGGRPPQADRLRATADVVSVRLPRARLVRVVPAGRDRVAIDLVIGTREVCRLVVRTGTQGLAEASATRDSSVVQPCSRFVLAAVVPDVKVPGEGLPRRAGTTAY